MAGVDGGPGRAGAITERVRLAPLVLSVTYRHAAVLANWAATADHLSGGRLTLGLGAGWQQNEHAQYGIALGSPGERLARLDETCTALRGLLGNATTDLHGRYVVLDGARCEPKPIQAPLPLLIGGKGDRMLGLVARHADHWNMWGMPELLADRAEVFEQRCAEVGRDPATVRRSTQALVMVTDDRTAAESFLARTAPRAAFAGTPEQFADLVGQWAAVGIDEVIVPDWNLGTGSARADHLDAIRAAAAP